MWPWQKKRDSPGYPLKSISVVNSLPQYGQVTRATGSSAPFTVSYVYTNAAQKEKKPGKYQAIHKLLTGIGPVKYNGFMRFVGPVLHFVLHISEDGILS